MTTWLRPGGARVMNEDGEWVAVPFSLGITYYDAAGNLIGEDEFDVPAGDDYALRLTLDMADSTRVVTSFVAHDREFSSVTLFGPRRTMGSDHPYYGGDRE